MKTDSFFQQGSTHAVCEDYTIHGEDYAIVADGCSSCDGKGIMSDWGARLLALSAQQHIKVGNPETFTHFVAATAMSQLRLFPGLPQECLTSTLITLKKRYSWIEGVMIGDGIIGGKRKDGRWKIYHVEFLPGGTKNQAAPYYLRYLMFGEEAIWEEQYGGERVYRCYFGNLMDESMEYPDILPSYENRKTAWSRIMTCSEKVNNFMGVRYLTVQFPIDEYDFVFACSDGPDSFVENRNSVEGKCREPVHLLDVLRIMLDFRSFPNGFANLQRNWAFRQNRLGTFVRRRWENQDDVSLGVIYCGD